MHPEHRCKTCLYFQQLENEEVGFCRRQPPAAMITTLHTIKQKPFMAIWPVVLTQDWCGEYADGQYAQSMEKS